MISKILFFPFTHIAQKQLDTVLTFCPLFEYFPAAKDLKRYPLVQEKFEQQKIFPLFSSPDDLAMVEQSVEQYLAWAQIHKGNEVNLKSLIKDNPYFTNDTQVTAIKSQIKSAKDDEASSLTGESALQRDLLFLKMAHLCDEQNESIDLELKTLDKNREKLVSTLRGLENDLNENDLGIADSGKDPGTMMTRERICAWSRCVAQKTDMESDGTRFLYVTTSEAVFDYIESNCSYVVNTLDIDKIKVHENECENKSEWQHQLSDYLMGAIQGDGNRKKELPKVNDGCSLSGQIKLGLFSGNNINKLFNTSDKQIPVCLIKLK